MAGSPSSPVAALGSGVPFCLRLARAGAKAVVVNYSRSDSDARATAAER